MPDLSTRLKQRRKLQGLTQTQLAERIGITQAFLAEIEKGRKRPSIEVLEKLCAELECSADYILGITQSRDYLKLEQNDVPPALLSRGITREMLQEVEKRNISGEEFRIALKIAQTMKDESGKNNHPT